MAKLRYKKALTTEDRLWRFVAENAQKLAEMAMDESIPNPSKKVRAEGFYASIREAFKSLGVVK